jgi:hypothetical protein
MLERVRKWIAVISLSISATMFWGLLFAGSMKYAFDLNEEWTLVAFIPAAIVLGIYFYFIRSKLARACGFDV